MDVFWKSLGLAAVGWLFSPIVGFLLNKFLSYLYDASQKLVEMRSRMMPRLKLTLEEVLEQRMLIELSHNEPHKLSDMDDLLRNLKNALYDAEDILDLVDYYRIEKELGKDSKTTWLQWCWQRLCESARERSAPLLRWVKQWLCWLWGHLRIAGERSAPMLQWVRQRLCIAGEKLALLLQLARQGLCWLWRRVPGSEELLPVASTASASLLQRISLWCRSFDFRNCCSCICNWLSKAIQGARYYRDWSLVEVGFTSYEQGVVMESNCTIMGPLYNRLKENKKKVEQLIDEAQKHISFKKKVQEGIEQVYQSRRNGSGTHIASATTGDTQKTASCPIGKVTGRDEVCEQIRTMLRATEADIVGIYGIAGSGKTTLAQYVCKSEKERSHFDLVIWIHVTHSFSVHRIFCEMFEAVSGESAGYISLDVLQTKLKNKLDRKRFLLVLDDIWCHKDAHEQNLQQLLLPLQFGVEGSKILATSRNKYAFADLGEQVRCDGIPIPDLNDEVFREIFMHYAIGSSRVDTERGILEKIGAEIAKKLKKSPLAARTVGGQLRRRQNVEFWRNVRDRDLWNETMGALWWSYQHLDEQVRRCFAYCSIFPRGYWLERDKLVKLWAAEGFAIGSNKGEDMEYFCGVYFDELVSASFLQLQAKMYPKGKDYYVFHDMLHDLAEKVAGSDCYRIENDSEEIGKDLTLEGCAEKIPREVRHVFVQIYDAALITEKICKLDNLRTLIIDSADSVEEKVLNSMFERLRKLRVLTMTCRGGSKVFISEGDGQFSVPASIGQLRHLRYFAFRSYGFLVQGSLVLPETLTKLYHMQVLDFYCDYKLVFTSDEDLCNLINLRHLIIREFVEISNIGRLTSLQNVVYFRARKEQGYELKQLGNLHKLSGSLCITLLENVESRAEALEAKLADKEGLKELKLWWYNKASPEVEAEVLEGLCPPADLESLDVINFKGLRYPSWMLGKHNGGPKCLKHLRFEGWIAEPGPELGGFCTHLRSLIIEGCSWDALPDYIEHLTSLESLQIYHSTNIRSLPTLPESLQVFIMCYCDEELMSSCSTIGSPNWEKIQHIPEARIGDWRLTVMKMGVVQDPKDGSSTEEYNAEIQTGRAALRLLTF